MTLMLHSGANPVSYDELRSVTTPAATDTHVPVPHHEIVELTVLAGAITTLNFPLDVSAASFYFRGTLAEDVDLTVSSSSPSLTSAMQRESVVAGTQNKLVIPTMPTPLPALTTPFTVMPSGVSHGSPETFVPGMAPSRATLVKSGIWLMRR